MAQDKCYSCNRKVTKSSSRYLKPRELVRFAFFMRFSKGFPALAIVSNRTKICMKCVASSKKFAAFVKKSKAAVSDRNESAPMSTSSDSTSESLPSEEPLPVESLPSEEPLPVESLPSGVPQHVNQIVDVQIDCVISKSRACFVCNAYTRTRVKNNVRYQIWLLKSIFVKNDTRMCSGHLVDGDLPDEVIHNITDVNSSGSLSSTEIGNFLKGLSIYIEDRRRRSIESFVTSDNDSKVLMSLSQEQFHDVHSTVEEKLRTIRSCSTKTAVALLLIKLRIGLSNAVLSVFFQMKESTIMNIIKMVLAALEERFVPLHYGIHHVSRADLIAKHQSPAAVRLFARNSPESLLTIVDGTYIKVGRSSDYTVLQNSFCVHKGQHIFKPMLLVTTTGYIIEIIGPYFANGRNNDARILNHAIKTREDLKAFFKENDIVLADRGFRDSNTMLSDLGVNLQMPSFLSKGEKQVGTNEVNRSRKVTFLRWPVEVRNGHLQGIFRLFQHRIHVPMIPYVTELLHVCASLLNAYHPELQFKGQWERVVEKMEATSHLENPLKELVERHGILRKPSQWQKLDDIDLGDFPVLSEEDVRGIVLSDFKYRRAESYVALTVEKCGSFDVELCKMENDLLRVRVRSQFSGASVHQALIRYIPNSTGLDAIPQWYCNCKGGALTVGTCAHVSSLIWYLGYRRHEERGNWYQSKLRQLCEDAAELDLPSIV